MCRIPALNSSPRRSTPIDFIIRVVHASPDLREKEAGLVGPHQHALTDGKNSCPKCFINANFATRVELYMA